MKLRVRLSAPVVDEQNAPIFGKPVGYRYPTKWRISNGSKDTSLGFEREADALMALRALNELGITTDADFKRAIDDGRRNEIDRAMIEALAW